MTSRERVQAVLHGEIPDRLPYNFCLSDPLAAQLAAIYGPNYRATQYGADVIETFLLIDWFPQLAGRGKHIQDEVTNWTVEFPVTDLRELDELDMPDPQDPKIYSQIVENRQNHPDKALWMLQITPLDVLLGIAGMETVFLELYEQEEVIERFLHRVSDFLQQVIRRGAAMDIDAVYLMGDICSSKGQMISNDALRRFCFAPIRPLIDIAHQAGRKVLYHTDGYVMDILPLVIEAGIDMINPLQYNLHDIEAFAREYGDRLMVYGAMDNCFILPDGSEQEIRQHIRRLFEVLGRRGRYIASSHDIPATAPLSHLDIMVDELQRCRYT